MLTNRQKGNFGEEIARKYLERKNYLILDKNVHFVGSEIDIVAYKDQTVIFTEVKYRTNEHYGDILSSVGKGKVYKLLRGVRLYLLKKFGHCHVRYCFDLILILSYNQKLLVEHYTDVLPDFV